MTVKSVIEGLAASIYWAIIRFLLDAMPVRLAFRGGASAAAGRVAPVPATFSSLVSTNRFGKCCDSPRRYKQIVEAIIWMKACKKR